MKVDLFSQRSLQSLVLFHLLIFLCHDVAVANTEIINFSPSRDQTVDLPRWDVLGNGSTLRPSDNQRQWTIQAAALHTPLHRVCDDDLVAAKYPPLSCPHELWLFLDLDDAPWASYSTFTLRLSWPASIPADFEITIYTPADLLARLPSSSHPISQSSPAASPERPEPRGRSTRARYARIRAVNAGVPALSLGSRSPRTRKSISISPPAPRLPQHEHEHEHEHGHEHPHHPHIRDLPDRWAPGTVRVPFVVILEPCYWGVLPASLLPTVCFLVPILLGATLFVPRAIAYFEPYVRQAREDLKVQTTRTIKKER